MLAALALLGALPTACGGGGCADCLPDTSKITSIVIQAPTTTLLVGDSTRLTAALIDQYRRDASESQQHCMSWSSLSPAIATVRATVAEPLVATVTAVAPGSAQILAQCQQVTTVVVVTVAARPAGP